MTYDASEISVQDGQPVELYKWLLREGGQGWYYTSAGYEINYGGNVYAPLEGLYRDDLDDADDPLKTECVVRLPSASDMAQEYMYAIPDDVTDFTLYRAHGANVVSYWTGVLKTVNPLENGEEATFMHGLHSDILGATFLLRRWTRVCDVPVFSGPCGLIKATWKATGSLDTVVNKTLTTSSISGYDDTHFTGGWIRANGRRMKIKRHTYETLLLVAPIPGLTAGMTFEAWPGCNKLRSTCKIKFNNLDNYPGCDFIPDNEPFTQRVLG